MSNIRRYFNSCVSHGRETIGVEVETQFLDNQMRAISTKTSQDILRNLMQTSKWQLAASKSGLITELVNENGDKILYELGRHNLELAMAPQTNPFKLIKHTKDKLSILYDIARQSGAFPYFEPILFTEEDLLVIPDERDKTWLKLDGRRQLNELSKISSVQFTFSISPDDAIKILNKLAYNLDKFLSDFPQDHYWRRYVRESLAGYHHNRYGGPLFFESIEDYVLKLAIHKAICGQELINVNKVPNLDIPLYLRSIWWHFRLKRYGDQLCVEVRPLARRSDDILEKQLELTLSAIE